MISDFNRLLSQVAKQVHDEIVLLLPKGNSRLVEAMNYSCLSEGKKLRPFLHIVTADLFNVERRFSLRVAATLEITHIYSLIHDDLPSMDNDDYRRGQLSCHKKFDEATATLTGDSLLTLAFEILSDPKTCDDGNLRCQLINILAKDIGYLGMAGGQMQDLIYEREIIPSFDQLQQMHLMKTAKLFSSCCLMAAKLGKASAEEELYLSRFAELYGLAFQYVDDLDDVHSGKILLNNNIVKSIGVENTKEKVKEIMSSAIAELDIFAEKAEILRVIARNLIEKI